MNAREDLIKVLNGDEPEITPFSAYESFFLPHKQDPDLKRLLDMGLILTPQVETVKRIRHGMNEEVINYEKDGHACKIVRWNTPVGTLQQTLRSDRWDMEYFVKSPTDYKILKWIVENTEIEPDYDAFFAKEEEFCNSGLVLAYANRTPAMVINVDWAGAERFCLDLAMEIQELFDLYDSMKKLFIEETKIIAGGPGRFVKWNENLTINLLGPKRYRELLAPLRAVFLTMRPEVM